MINVAVLLQQKADWGHEWAADSQDWGIIDIPIIYQVIRAAKGAAD